MANKKYNLHQGHDYIRCDYILPIRGVWYNCESGQWDSMYLHDLMNKPLREVIATVLKRLNTMATEQQTFVDRFYGVSDDEKVLMLVKNKDIAMYENYFYLTKGGEPVFNEYGGVTKLTLDYELDTKIKLLLVQKLNYNEYPGF